MDGEGEKKFICRYCNKRYRCGKSLGGHLRSHRIAGIGNVVDAPNHSAAAGESAAYVLRENPKKTRRFADSRGGGGATPELNLERFCKECGKGFRSMKALCGHMACHSDKDGRRLSAEVEVLDSQSETDTAPIEKRSKRVRYRTLDFNGSSSVSEIEQEQEQQEEVALCLMMLSRDCGGGFVKGLSSFAESSDNNSVVLEAKSSSIDMNKSGFAFADSGYFRNGAEKVKSDVFVDGFEIDGKFNTLGKKNKSGFGFINKQLKQIKADQSVNYGPIHRSSSKRIKDHELWEICHKKIENGTASIDESCKIGRKRSEFEGFSSKINGCYDSICESGENSIEADSFAAPIHRSGNGNKVEVNKGLVIKAKKRLGTKKSKGHECPICFRVFKSGQALGGHKRSHFIGGSDGRTVVVIAKQQVSRLLDLNLPAPDEEEDTQGRSNFTTIFGHDS